MQKEAAAKSPRRSAEPPRVLMIEDNAGDVELVREALREHGVDCVLTAINDGEKALAFLDRIESGEIPCPALIILDLNLPKIPGGQILKKIRLSPGFGRVPVAILSSSQAASDMEEARRLGANRYVRKPSTLDEFMKTGAVFKDLLG